MNPKKKDAPTRDAIQSRLSDFWLLGGISILAWIIFVFAQPLRSHFQAVDERFIQMGVTFSVLSLVCNYPHFIASYHLAYRRGRTFLKENLFQLVLVPLALAALFIAAYLSFDRAPAYVSSFSSLGTELMSIAVWIMYLTVGWHYSKQVFGCMMVYAKYDRYPLKPGTRKLIKASLTSVACYNLIHYALSLTGTSRFFNIPLSIPEVSEVLEANRPIANAVEIGSAAVVILLLAAVLFRFYQTWKIEKRAPSASFLVPWIAFHLWWIPPVSQAEYYVSLVPFFHSLQYLPFVFRMEGSRIESGHTHTQSATARGQALSWVVLGILAVGYLSFEGLPSVLDQVFEMTWKTKTAFFTVVATVFINIHHFFIDSVIWKLSDPSVRRGLFETGPITLDLAPSLIPTKTVQVAMTQEISTPSPTS